MGQWVAIAILACCLFCRAAHLDACHHTGNVDIRRWRVMSVDDMVVLDEPLKGRTCANWGSIVSSGVPGTLLLGSPFGSIPSFNRLLPVLGLLHL